MLPAARLALACLFTWYALSLVKAGPYQWMKYDNFDEIMDKFSSVTADNCRSKPQEELALPAETVAQVPRYNLLLSAIVHANRSSLLHLHNMALNRAFFYSFIYQKLNKTEDFFSQPGLMYLYMSAGADVSANPSAINGSAIYYDNDCNYANWYSTLDFNKTLPLFGPRAWRADDYNEPTNLLREPTNNTIDIQDYAAGRQSNYTNSAYKTNQWYKKDMWNMPDISEAEDSLRKFTYTVGIKYSNTTGHFTDDEFEATPFFGPPNPGQQEQTYLPVLFTTPYFDCGRSNKWIVSATAPVVEFMSRYSPWLHLRRPRYVAIVSEDIEFERIDINPCPTSAGNMPPNFFAGTDRCKHETTMCEPLHGHGFRRGGYQCLCRPGFRYPWWHSGPWLGVEIEQASETEYNDGFDCFNVDWRIVTPVQDPTFVTKRSVRTPFLDTKSRFLRSLSPAEEISHRFPKPVERTKRNLKRAHLVSRRMIAEYAWEKRSPVRLMSRKKREAHSRQKRNTYDPTNYDALKNILQKVVTTTGSNCQSMKPSDLLLPGDVSYGVESQFEMQGRVALRLAHFLSDFMQNVGDYEEFGIIKGDRRLNETHIFGEVLSNVMGDLKIRASGVFFDRYKFRMSPPLNNTDPRFQTGVTREFFGPSAWRTGTKEAEFRALDYAGFQDSYVNQRWFRDMKSRWATNVHGLKTYTNRPMIRSDINGTSSIRFEHFPMKFKAPLYESGEWLRPEFKCDGRVNNWVITYVTPFFGLDSIRSKIEFKGVVTVDVDLQELSINQCPASFSVPNAFKNTAQCDYDSTYCVPLPGMKFHTGYFKCECKTGYEYPFNDLTWFFLGHTMEEEYSKYIQGLPSRYPTLKCRISGAGRLGFSGLLAGAATTLLYLLH